jgi:hypothetical protein
MKIVKRSSSLIKAMFLGLILVLAVPTVSFAQGRGRGWGRGRDRHVNKKLGKFINGHDARDGRWDGRGPNRGVRIGDILRNRRQRRINRLDLDRDGDFDRNDARLRRRLVRRHGRWQ